METNLLTNFIKSAVPYLIEIRRRLIHTLVFFICVLSALLPFNQSLFTFITTPLLQWLPEQGHLISTQITATLIVPIKLTLYCSTFITMPFLIYQGWLFASPALYRNEKNHTLSLIIFSLFLFLLGVLFAFYFILPIIFKFLVQSTPTGVLMMTDISAYFDFITTMLLAFGLAFQCPIIIILLVKYNVVELTTIKKNRPYFIIFAFTIGMLLTPPDVISQTLLAIPLCLLFESAILLLKIMNKKITTQNIIH